MADQAKKYQTQWAAQFYVAAELTRMGYLVSLTLGNAPVVDLLVVSPRQQHFEIDVKGQSTKNFWLIRQVEPRDDLYYVFVFLPQGEQPQYFIFSSKELMKERDDLRNRSLSQGGKWNDKLGGIRWTTSIKSDYKNRWDKLPK